MLPALSLLIVCTLTCNGLLAVWAATSSRHWFLRAVGFLSPTALLLIVPAYEPWLALTMQSATLVGVLTFTHRIKGDKEGSIPRDRLRFGMADMLLATAIVAYFVGVATRILSSELQNLGLVEVTWFYVLCQGVMHGLVTTCAWLVSSLTGRRMALFAPLGAGASLLLAFPTAYFDGLVESLAVYSGDDFLFGFLSTQATGTALEQLMEFLTDQSTLIWIFLSAVHYAVTLLLIGLIRRKSNRTLRFRRRLAFLMTIGFACFPMIAYWHLATPPPIPAVDYPEPNGYLLLIELAEETEKATINNFNYDPETATNTEREQAAAEVDTIVAEAQKAIRLPSLVPIKHDESDLPDIQPVRSLARAIGEVAGVHAMNERWQQACDGYFYLVNYGKRISHGGLMIDDLVGLACSGMGIQGIYDIHQELSQDQRQQAIQRLTEYLEEHEPIERFIERDRIWTIHSYGWVGGLLDFLQGFGNTQGIWSLDSYRSAWKRRQLAVRMLQLVLAMENFRDRQDRLPETLQELELGVEMLVDPFDPEGGPLRYRILSPEKFLLYSVGTNQADDGGEFNLEDLFADKGDLTLELLFESDRLEAEAMAKEQAELDALEAELEEDLGQLEPQTSEIIEP